MEYPYTLQTQVKAEVRKGDFILFREKDAAGNPGSISRGTVSFRRQNKIHVEVEDEGQQSKCVKLDLDNLILYRDTEWEDGYGYTIQRNCEEGICPLCGNELEYEASDDCGLHDWSCPECGATGKEGYDKVFDGFHYDVKDGGGVDVAFLPEPADAEPAVPFLRNLFRMICGSLPRQPKRVGQFVWSDGSEEIFLSRNEDKYAIAKFLQSMGIQVQTGYHNGWHFVRLRDEEKPKEIDLAETAHAIVETLKDCGFNHCTDTSGFFTIKDFGDDRERCVEAYKSDSNGIPHYVIYCAYEDESSTFEFTEDLSVEALEKILRELAQ